MLRNEHLLEEIKELEKQYELKKKTDPFEAAKLKSSILTNKLLHNLRTNMVTIMKHLKVPLLKPSHRDDVDGEDNT